MIPNTVIVGLGLALALGTTATRAGAAAGDEVLCAKVKPSTGELKGSVKIRRLSAGGCKVPKEEEVGTVAGLAAAIAPADRSYVRVFMPSDVNQGPLTWNNTVRVNFTNEDADTLGEWDTSLKEFTAQNAGLYLVQTTVEFRELADGSEYWVSIVTDSGESGGMFTNMSPKTGSSSSAIVSAHGSLALQLDAGDKIWITVDHNDQTNSAEIYWRKVSTHLYITRIG